MHKSTDLPDGLSLESHETIGSQGFLSKEFRLWNRYVMQKLLIAALKATEYHKHLAEKVLHCHKEFRGRRCENGHMWASPDQFRNSCSVRLCPHCAHRKSKIQATKVQKFMVGRTGRYAVLAERNSKNLAAGIRSLYESWSSLRRSVRWKNKVKGCVAVLEVTYNKDKRTWHPHLNVLFEGEYFPFEELKQVWIKATNGRGQTSYIQPANEGTAFELIKYTLKVAELKDTAEGKVYELLIDDPAALDEFLSAVYGLRLIRTYGTFRSMAIEEDEEEVESESCPDCGSDCWVDVGAVQIGQLSFDFGKKVFRVVRPPCERERALHLVRQPTMRLSTNPEAIAVAVEVRKRIRRYERKVAGMFEMSRKASDDERAPSRSGRRTA